MIDGDFYLSCQNDYEGEFEAFIMVSLNTRLKTASFNHHVKVLTAILF